MVKSFLFQLLLLFCSGTMLLGQQQQSVPFWSDISEKSLDAPGLERYIKPVKYRTVTLNLPVLRSVLDAVVADNTEAVIEIPTPDGKSERFKIHEASVMHPELQAKYPEIRCFTGKSLDNPSVVIKCDLTPWGFHAMTIGSGSSIYIDPYFHGDAGTGIVYFKKDYRRSKTQAFECLTTTPNENWQEIVPETTFQQKDEAEAGDCQLRTYRLALACTGEYAAFHGGTKPLVLAAFNTSMNRVNGVYQKDLAITMQLVPKTDTLIFFNSATDPYTNNNGGTMLGQNQTTCTQRIGSANYDIGHVFSTGGGGIAGLGVICNNTSKANGVTGSGAPIGDPFDIDYVAHEMGHQFGAEHSFNNSCGGNINSATAVEPGSGSTIMSYAGICSPNVQNNSDDYFHAINIQEIIAYTNTGTGNGCAVKTVTGNTNPTVGNVPNYTIPKSTPFALTASANDVDGDVLTYCWEQMDNQSATMPPVSTSTGGPLFRSYDPVTSPTRYFPNLPDLVANVNSQWEELPGVARTMNFRVVVRDNHAGAGCTAEDNVLVTVAGSAGPFAVTAPNTNVTWYALEQKTVTWNVNGTDAAPVNCANVKITLSTDGGFTYPVVLAESVPNTGSAVITVPFDVTSTTCRVKVEAVGNIFFDISNTNFTIQGSLTPTFVISTLNSKVQVCAGNDAEFDLNVIGLTGFSSMVDLSVSGAPAGATVNITPGQITPTGPVSLTVANITPAMAGIYTLTITGTGSGITMTQQLELDILPGIPTDKAVAATPANGGAGVSTFAQLSWDPVQYADNYTVEIADNPSFSQSVIVLNTTTTSVTTPELSFETPYYWRVIPGNQCGNGTISPIFSFQTGAEQCGQVINSTNVPVLIDVNGAINVSSNLTVAQNSAVIDVDVSINIPHTWVGDIDASLVGPGGESVKLFDRPGVPADSDGCSNDNIVASFNDDASQNASVLENMCNSTAPAISGNFKPIGSLSLFNGKNAQGNWKLEVNDNYPGEDEGQITSWSLTFCFSGPIDPGQILKNEVLSVVSSESADITTVFLEASASGTADEVVYTIVALPASGTLTLNGVAMGIGGHFTQSDINAGSLAYTHNGDTAPSDAFQFDVLDQNNNGWVGNQTFHISIVQNTLAATASVTTEISCHDGSNGAITVTTTGGTAPLTFSLNGGTGQSSNVFSNLTYGIAYTVVVTDALGFSQTAGTFTLSNPAEITISTSVSFDDLNVLATGGTGTLEYSIDGTNFQPDGQFADLADGIYTVTIRDANGCTASTEVAVSVSALLTTVAQTADINCFGEATAAITASVAGGFAPYQYSLDGTVFQDENVFEGLSAGTYTVTVRDANGTTTVSTAVTIGQPTALAATASVALNVITVNASGGTPFYAYVLNGAGQGSNTFTVGTNGDYTIIVADINGCTVTATATVNVASPTITDLDLENLSTCDGVIGTATVSATGGIPPYQYRLDGGSWQSSATFLNVTPGSHIFEVQDAWNIIASFNIVVAQPTPITALANVQGNNVTVTASGGTGPYTYTLNNGNPQNTGVFNGLPAGSYTVVVTDANGCTAVAAFPVTYVPMTTTAVVKNISCFGLSDGSIDFTINGGVAPYSFLLDPAGPWQNLPAGSYSATITDAIGYTITANYAVLEPTILTAVINQSVPATVTVNASGGTGPYQYSIDNGLNFQTGNVFTNVTNGTYTVIVKDANGCTYSESIEVSGTVEPSVVWGLTIAPNPGDGLFRIEMGNAPAGKMQVTVYDAAGRLIQNLEFSSNGGPFQTSIDLTAMPAGMYLLRLTNGTDTGAVRLSKM